jgi:transcriptional regulator with XRE-family HTH domain
MNEKKIPLHKRIRELRINKSLTQKDLAAELGLDNKMISFYENGKSIPSIDILIKIARIFNVSVDYLLFDDIPKRPFKQIDQNNSKNLNIISSIKWQIVIIIVLSISFIISGNILLYKLNKKNIQNESLIKINTIVEQININIERIKYASRIITDDQFMFKGDISLRDLNKNRASIVLDTVKTIFNASLVYFMDENGTVISCTTFNNGETLLGQDYRFRPYFI